MRGRTHKPRMFHVYTRYIIYLLKGLKEQQRTSEFINKGVCIAMIDPLLCAVSIVLCSILLEKSIEEDCVRKEAKKMFKEQISEASFVPVSARIDNKYIVVISILFWVYDIRFIFMIVTGLFENGIFVCMFLLCLSGVVVFFFGRLYILAYKKADESPIAYSVQAISAITFVYAIVCGGLEFVGLYFPLL